MRVPDGWGHFPENSAHLGVGVLFVGKMISENWGNSISKTGYTNLGLCYSNWVQFLVWGLLFHDENLNKNFCMSLVISAEFKFASVTKYLI